MSQGRELLLSPEEQLRLTIKLHQENLFGIKEDPKNYIKLISERMSPHYLNMRDGIGFMLGHVAGVMGEVTRKHVVKRHVVDYPHDAYQRTAGTPEAMTSYAPDIARAIGVPLIQPRVDMKKASGNKAPVLGRYNPGDRVAAYDDVVTDGKSKIDLITALGDSGLEVVDFYLLVDREEGGAAQVQEATGVEVTPVLAVSNMAIMLFAEGQIGQTQYDNVVEYLTEWGDPVAQEALGIAA